MTGVLKRKVKSMSKAQKANLAGKPLRAAIQARVQEVRIRGTKLLPAK